MGDADDEINACACGAEQCVCNPFEEREDVAPYPGAVWTFGRCGSCARDRSISAVGRTCESCSSSALRSYFTSNEAAENAARIIGL